MPPDGNGGQYAHAAVWALMAQARLQASGVGNVVADQAARPKPPAEDRVWDWFTGLSPAHRTSHPTRGPAYGLEPYVMAGDIYSQAPYVGRGGWSWYTGAAAWLHRAAVESIFGLQLGAQELSFTPCLPTHWPRAELCLSRDGRTMRFVFIRGDAQAALDALHAELPDARMLRTHTPLDWIALPTHSVFVVPLRDEPIDPLAILKQSISTSTELNS